MHHIPLKYRVLAIPKTSIDPKKIANFFDTYQGIRLSQDRTKVRKAAEQLIDDIDTPTPAQIESALNNAINHISISIGEALFETKSLLPTQQETIRSELTTRNIETLFINDFNSAIKNLTEESTT